MVRSKRLLPIQKLAENKEKEAAQALGESIQTEQHEVDKLAQLQTYQTEYLNQMQDKVKQGVTGSTLQRYHDFLKKLDLAIQQQKRALEKCSDNIHYNQEQWRDKHGRTQAISQAIHKIENQEESIKQKKENKSNDELSTQAYIRRQNISKSF